MERHTNKMRLIGDVHGKYRNYATLLMNTPDDMPSIQVGDFGIGFGPVPTQLEELMVKRGDKFIRGNHDKPSECKQHSQWIPDGSVYNDVFCIGGASSIDRAYRTEDVDWWPDEELSIAELNKAIDIYTQIKPKVVVSHDCPEAIARILFEHIYTEEGSNRTRDALQAMYDIHMPQFWIFGHWHTNRMALFQNTTTFVCLNELNYIDIEI